MSRMAHDDAWEERDGALRRHFEFADFSAAFAFMTRVALLGREAQPPPGLVELWNKVDITLSTHDAGSTSSPTTTVSWRRRSTSCSA